MGESSAEKSEMPTPKRLQDARKKGQVSKSPDVVSTALLAGTISVVAWLWQDFLHKFGELVSLPGQLYGRPFDEAFGTMLKATGVQVALLTLPIIGTVIVVAIAANFFQTGPVLSFEPLKPELNKLNPLEGLKKIFSLKNFFEFGKNLLKVGFLGVLIYQVVVHSIEPLLKSPYGGITGVLALLPALLTTMVTYTLIVYAAFAAADFFFQKWQFIKQMKMTKDEVKREYKEQEGDPNIKSKRKQLAKEMIMNDSVDRARKATVLVTNPTHYAVALMYDQDKTKLPFVLAKGEGATAQAMIKAAQDAGVPIMRNVPLAHALWEQAPVEQYIPGDLIEPVVEVLKWVRQLRAQQEGGWQQE